MTNPGIISVIIIIVTIIVSYNGLRNHTFLDRYSFEVDKILINKDYKRLVTSGFLHVSWWHLIFNMLSLYFFSDLIESYLNEAKYLIIYFSSLIGGNLFSLFIHRRDGDYSAVGASGAVCGVIFACIALFPGLSINLFVISIPSWLYGLVYVLGSIYGIRSKRDNIGHEAHLGGAMIGLIIAIIMQPSSLTENYLPILVITIPCIIFIWMIAKKPGFLLVDNKFFKTNARHYSIEHKYNLDKMEKQNAVDRILDKIRKKGINSLTKKEKELLDDYSKTIH